MKFPFNPSVLHVRPKRTASGQFKFLGKVQVARVRFSATALQIPALWPTGAGELSGADPRAGPFWSEPVLRTRAFRLRTDWSDRTDRTNGERPKFKKADPFTLEVVPLRQILRTPITRVSRKVSRLSPSEVQTMHFVLCHSEVFTTLLY